jgi:hypothetical protein
VGLVGWPAAGMAVAVGVCRVVSAMVLPIPTASDSLDVGLPAHEDDTRQAEDTGSSEQNP